VIAPGPVSTPAGDKAMRVEKAILDDSDRRGKADEMFTRSIREGMDPLRVAEVVLQVIRAKWPRGRYPVGFQSRATAATKRLIPRTGFEAAVRWGLGSG
jgi:hypothetical protein